MALRGGIMTRDVSYSHALAPARQRRHLAAAAVRHGAELGDDFSEIICDQGLMTISGFGSLLSEASARSTFPNLVNFRSARVDGFRRTFAHTCNIFYDRGIARPETGEVSSLSVEEHPASSIIVTLFEVEASPAAIAAFIEREHEFRFLAVQPRPLHPSGPPETRPAVICGRWNDDGYKARRCPPDEWQKRYGRHNLDSIWTDESEKHKIKPCRAYLRHCVLAARRLGPEAAECFLKTGTVLADGKTSVEEWLNKNPEIMDELPPPSLIGRYSG